MRLPARTFVLAGLIALAPSVRAQVALTKNPPPAPTTRAEVGHWDLWIVDRAAVLLATPEQWNHDGRGPCLGTAKSFSIICALNRAVEEGAGIFRDENGKRAGFKQSPAPLTSCSFHPVAGGSEGSCGTLFDEVPIISIAKTKAVTSGVWRTDAKPTEIWAGVMSDAEGPVMFEARQLVDVVGNGKKYPGRLVGYNNDSATTFADIQKYLQLLRARVAERGSADLEQSSSDSVEIEVYAGGTGVIRTYIGWYAISGFSSTASGMQFRVDTSDEVPPNAVDRDILIRASKVITSDAVWNRADDRKCPATATTWSIYCAVEKAELEVTGGFHHRRPAMELVRVIIEDRAKTKTYEHRMMGYNNDSTTTLADVRSLFAEAIAKVK